MFVQQLCDVGLMLFAVKVEEKGKYFFEDVNDIFADQVGIEKDEIIGACIRCIFRNRLGDGIMEMCRQSIESVGSRNIMVRFGLEDRYLIGVSHVRICKPDAVVYFFGTKIPEDAEGGDATDYEELYADLEGTPQADRSEYENMLREQLRFEELIAKFSRELLDRGYPGFDGCVADMIAELGRILRADQFFAVQFDHGAGSGAGSHQWAQKEQWLDSRLYQALKNDPWGAGLNRLTVINDTNDFGRAGTLKAVLQKDGIASLLAAPVGRDDDRWGFLCLTQIGQGRIWTTTEIGMIKTAAATIMSAHLRIKVEKQLSESNRILMEYDESLQEMLAVEETVAQVSRQYILAGVYGFDDCTYDMLKQIGELIDIDTVRIYLYKDKDTMHNTYDWCRKGLPHWIYKDAKMIMPGGILWQEEVTKRGSIVVDNTMEDMDGFSQNLADIMLNAGVKSLLAVPIQQANGIEGAMVFHNMIAHHRWTNTDINAAKVFSEVFMGAYARKLREEELLKTGSPDNIAQQAVKQADILHRITCCMRSFADIVTADNFFVYAKAMCQEIAELMDIERISFFRYAEDQAHSILVFDWHPDALAPYENVRPIHLQHAVRSSHMHDRCMPTSSEQDIADADYAGGNSESLRGFSMLYRDEVWGYVNVSVSREWQGRIEMEMLQLLAEIYVQAYMRVFPDKEK